MTPDRIREHFESALESFAASIAGSSRTEARSQVTEQLNQAVRRLRQTDKPDLWVETLAETARLFCGRSEVFLISGGRLRGCGVDAPLADAGAFRNAVESKDTVIAAATATELGAPIVDALKTSAAKVYLFPVLPGDQVTAILYAEPADGSLDVSALELLASIAPVLPPVPAAAAPSGLISIAGAKPLDRTLELRARRFARTEVAKLLLHEEEKVRIGRAEKNLATQLRAGIDGARALYNRQFPALKDYLHDELVGVLAQGDASLLGEEYPGPLRG